MAKMKGLKIFWLSLALVSTLLFAACGAEKGAPKEGAPSDQGKAAEKAQSAADFYKGKTIDFIVPYSPGGGYDAYPRMVAPFLEKTTGATIVIRNKPGGGSLVGTNDIFKAAPDGLTIGIINGGGTLSSTIAGADGVMFDMKKFSYVGRFAAEPMVLMVRKDFEADTMEKIKALPKPMKLGTEGMGSNGYNIAVIDRESLGLPIDIVTGYDSSGETALALARGEIDAQSGSLSSNMTSIKNGEVKPVLLMGSKRAAELPDTPVALELPMSDEDKAVVQAMVGLLEVGRAVVAPPGVPADRLQFLREALDKAFKDPELVDAATKSKRPLENANGDDLQKMVEQSLNAPAKFNQMIKDSYKPSK